MPLIKNVKAREMVGGAVVMNLGDVREEAAAILEQAKIEAARIVADAEAEAIRRTEGAAERGHLEGYARGEAEGRAAGLEQGRLEGAAAAEEALAARLGEVADGWSTALAQLLQAREALQEEARRDLLRLALAIAERVLGGLPAHDPSVVVEQVEGAIAMLAGATRLVVRIHPDDLEVVETHFAGVATAIQRASEVDVVLETDPDLVRGGCVVSAGDGEIDARLDAQVSRIVHGIFPELLETPPAAPSVDPRGPEGSATSSARVDATVDRIEPASDATPDLDPDPDPDSGPDADGAASEDAS